MEINSDYNWNTPYKSEFYSEKEKEIIKMYNGKNNTIPSWYHNEMFNTNELSNDKFNKIKLKIELLKTINLIDYDKLKSFKVEYNKDGINLLQEILEDINNM